MVSDYFLSSYEGIRAITPSRSVEAIQRSSVCDSLPHCVAIDTLKHLMAAVSSGTPLNLVQKWFGQLLDLALKDCRQLSGKGVHTYGRRAYYQDLV